MTTADKIQYNNKVHNKIAAKYEKKHPEIFNKIEQTRIARTITQVIETAETGNNTLKALDVGCGNGNLTAHLINQGVHTVSADVSENFLRLIERAFTDSTLSDTLKLNGRDFENLSDASFDIVAAYSVIHHVPDYLHLVREMCRVLKKGGILYLDHEHNEAYFKNTGRYQEFKKQAIPKTILLKKYARLLLSPPFYLRFVRKRFNPRYSAEGDIHVWPDDHIEWHKIEILLSSENFEILQMNDYLAYDSAYRKELYNQYKDKCTDMKLLIAQKK
ncbi:MAG: class I SAM-dependent methyltransferase [Planctomycetes bacterium]|nr:class I SAM-dependent methyltransferase [Planctomycetota bacterium]